MGEQRHLGRAMNAALGVVCLNEAAWLRLHLPVMLQASRIGGVVCVDGGSSDGSPDVVKEIALAAGKRYAVSVRPWDWRFDEQQNAVIRLAEQQGYTALLKWDPDELLFPGDVDSALAMLEMGAKAVVFPRVNFEGDRLHYAPQANPRDALDMQTRAHVLGEGFAWRGRLHASVNAWDLWKELPTNGGGMGQIVRLLFAPIFHYEGIKPLPERALKWLNYQRVREGLPTLTALPEGYELPSTTGRLVQPYYGAQPLDPQDIGVMAPYAEVRS